VVDVLASELGTWDERSCRASPMKFLTGATGADLATGKGRKL